MNKLYMHTVIFFPCVCFVIYLIICHYHVLLASLFPLSLSIFLSIELPSSISNPVHSSRVLISFLTFAFTLLTLLITLPGCIHLLIIYLYLSLLSFIFISYSHIFISFHSLDSSLHLHNFLTFLFPFTLLTCP